MTATPDIEPEVTAIFAARLAALDARDAADAIRKILRDSNGGRATLQANRHANRIYAAVAGAASQLEDAVAMAENLHKDLQTANQKEEL